MQRTRLFLFLSVGLLACVAKTDVSDAGTLSPALVQAVTDSVSSAVDSLFAANSRLDGPRLNSYFAREVTGLSSGAVINSQTFPTDNIAWLTTMASLEVTAGPHRVDVLSTTIAVWHGQFRYAHTDKSGKTESGTEGVSYVFQRRPEGWRVVHLHLSEPLPPAK